MVLSDSGSRASNSWENRSCGVSSLIRKRPKRFSKRLSSTASNNVVYHSFSSERCILSKLRRLFSSPTKWESILSGEWRKLRPLVRRKGASIKPQTRVNSHFPRVMNARREQFLGLRSTSERKTLHFHLFLSSSCVCPWEQRRKWWYGSPLLLHRCPKPELWVVPFADHQKSILDHFPRCSNLEESISLSRVLKISLFLMGEYLARCRRADSPVSFSFSRLLGWVSDDGGQNTSSRLASLLARLEDYPF